MKFVNARPYAQPEAAARKLVEIAAGIKPVQEDRIYIELVNWQARRGQFGRGVHGCCSVRCRPNRESRWLHFFA